MTAEPVRMTQTTRIVLRWVANADADGGHVWAAQVARDGVLDPDTVAVVLHRLAARGWLKRTIEDADPAVLKRPLRALYEFTEDGRKAYCEQMGDR